MYRKGNNQNRTTPLDIGHECIMDEHVAQNGAEKMFSTMVFDKFQECQQKTPIYHPHPFHNDQKTSKNTAYGMTQKVGYRFTDPFFSLLRRVQAS